MFKKSFRTAFQHELRLQMNAPATWFCALILIFVTWMHLFGSDFDAVTAGSGLPLNAGYTAYVIASFGSFWIAVFGAYFFGATITRDITRRFSSIVWACPISARGYLVGRSAAALVVMAIVSLAGPLGFILAPYISGDLSAYGPVPWTSVFWAWAIITVPSFIIYGGLQGGLCAATGRMTPAYAVVMLAMALAVTFGQLAEKNVNMFPIASLMDMSTVSGVDFSISSWTADQKLNAFLFPQGSFLINRLLWPAIGIVCFIWGVLILDPRRQIARMSRRKPAKRSSNSELGLWDQQAQSGRSQIGAWLPKVSPNFSNLDYLISSIRLGVSDVILVSRAPVFRILVGVFLIFAFFAALDFINMADSPNGAFLPTTDQTVFKVARALYFISAGICLFYSGEIIHRERTARFNLLVDATRAPDWALYVRKFFAVFLLGVVCCPLLIAVPSLLGQIARGALEIDFVYVRDFFLLWYTPSVWLFLGVAVLAHVLSGDKRVGNTIGFAFMIIMMLAGDTGFIEHTIAILGVPPKPAYYNAFNGYGQFLQKGIDFTLFWMGIVAFCVLVSGALWARGNRGRADFLEIFAPSRRIIAAFSVFALVFVGARGWLLYERMYVVNELHDHEEEYAEAAAYELKYAERVDASPLRVISVETQWDVTRAEREAVARLRFVLRNESDAPVGAAHISMPEHVELLEVGQGIRLEPDAQLRAFQAVFDEPIGSGEERGIELTTREQRRYYVNRGYNGTLSEEAAVLMPSMLPVIGYDRSRELINPTLREQEELPRMRSDAGGAYLNAPGVGMVAKSVVDVTAQDPQSIAVVSNSGGGLWRPLAVVADYHIHTSDDGLVTVYSSQRDKYLSPAILNAATEALFKIDGMLGVETTPVSVAEVPKTMQKLTAAQGLLLVPEEDAWLQDQSKLTGRAWTTYRMATGFARMRLDAIAPTRDEPGAILAENGLPLALGLAVVEQVHGKEAADAILDTSSWRYIRDAGDAGKAEPHLVNGYDETVVDHDGFRPAHGYLADKALLALTAARRSAGDETFLAGVDRWLRSEDAGRGRALPDYLATDVRHHFVGRDMVDVSVVDAIARETPQGWVTTVTLDLRMFSKDDTEPKPVEIALNVDDQKLSAKLGPGRSNIEVRTSQRPEHIVADPNWLLIDLNRQNNRRAPPA